MFKLKHESLIDSNSGLNRKKTKSLTPLDDEDINNNTNCNNTGEVSKKTAPVVKKNSRQFLSIIDNFLSKTKHGNVNNKQNYRQQQQLLGSASKCELIELDSLTSGDGVNGPSLAHAETTSSSTNSIDKLYKTESKSLGDFKVRLKNSPKVIYKTTVNKLTKGWQYAAAAGKSAVAKSDEIESIKMKESTSNDTGLVRPRCGSLFEAVDFTPQEVSLFETNRLDELENLSVLNSLLNSYRNRRADSFDGVSVGENFDQPEEYNSANGSYKNLVHFGVDTPGEETFLEHSDCEGNDDDDHKIPNLNELPYGWTCDRTSDGKIYYLNHITQTTQWTHPNLENHQNSFQPSPFSTDCNQQTTESADENSDPNCTMIELNDENRTTVQEPSPSTKPVSEPMARNHKTPSTKLQKQDNIQEYEQMLEQLYRSELIDLVVKYENYRSKLNEKLNSN